MSKPNAESWQAPLCGADLEFWRIENGLTKSEAADAFGLQKAKWELLVSTARAQDPLADPTIAMLLHLYRRLPESAPMAAPPNIGEFYRFLGLTDSRHDRETFAILIGRTHPSVHRLLFENGTPGRPVVRWIEAIRRLRLTSTKSRALMEDVAAKVGQRQSVQGVMDEGLRRPGALEIEPE